MRQISILGLVILVLVSSLVFALISRLGVEALCYVTGPILGATLAAWRVPNDRKALLTGGMIGGLCQALVVVLFLKRGYPFGDVALITGQLYLAALAVHLAAGLLLGGLLFLALRWAGPTRVS